MASSCQLIGVDMGATHTRICIATQQGEVLLTHQEKTADLIRNGLVAGILRFIQQYRVPEQEVGCLVMGLPALITPDSQSVLSTPNLPCDSSEFEGLVNTLRQAFFCPVFLERDVNLQLSFDVMTNQLQQKIVLGGYLGTGFGLSIWMAGSLFKGGHGVAGELGHIPVASAEGTCGCGNQGCLETVCSGRALQHWYQSEKRDYPFAELFTRDLQDAGLQKLLRHGAQAMATAINLFDPHAVLLGGGVIDMPDFPLESFIQQIGEYTRKPLPFEALKYYKADSSSFNGARGAVEVAKSHLMTLVK